MKHLILNCIFIHCRVFFFHFIHFPDFIFMELLSSWVKLFVLVHEVYSIWWLIFIGYGNVSLITLNYVKATEFIATREDLILKSMYNVLKIICFNYFKYKRIKVLGNCLFPRKHTLKRCWACRILLQRAPRPTLVGTRGRRAKKEANHSADLNTSTPVERRGRKQIGPRRKPGCTENPAHQTQRISADPTSGFGA